MALRPMLNFKQYLRTVHTLLYLTVWSVGSIKTSFYLSFSRNGPKSTLFEVDCWNYLFSLPFEKRARIPCLVWSCVLWCMLYARVDSFFVRFFRHHWGSHRLMTILLINIVVIRFDAFLCTLTFGTNNAILSPKYIIFIIGSIVLAGFRMFRGLSFGISPGELPCI